MVLGRSWDVVSDEISCKLPSNLDCTQEMAVKKRVLLSVISSVYNPIGFTAPALLLPKLLMQEAWRGKIGWDEVLPVELENKYRLWEKTMHLMSECTIPRRFFAENYDDFALHIFTDASASGYATCAFLRCEFKGQVTVKLIAANARLAPRKKSTIPRLELLGEALGARLAETVHSMLRTASKTYFWSYLMVVLSWIRKKSHGTHSLEIESSSFTSRQNTQSCSLSNNWRRSGRSSFLTWWKQSVDSSIHVCSVSSSPSGTSLISLHRIVYASFFWARRGRGSTLNTDNGTNFVGAANALKSLDWDFIQAECSLMKIKWLFSPPSAPWYGGFKERMVRSIKEILRKCFGKACVTYEETLTLLYDCEATINGQPLTYLSDDPKELKPLTPVHFIQDIKERETFDLDLIDSQHILKRVRYLHTLRSNLRKRFYKEYLGELVINPKVASRIKMISPGEIDCVEHVAKLRLASGEIIRPLQRIYPLELSASDHLIEDQQGTDRAAHIPGPTAADVLEEGKKSRCGRPLVPVKRLNL
ncbi:integrase catalytic domain-containing protein [Trichonephila clavipes]|nr:integrase catalytic domain-containing protein [Trichonephila clavipes]